MPVSKGSKQRPTDTKKFESNFDKIFGDKKAREERAVALESERVNAPVEKRGRTANKNFEPFNSPIDKTHIRNASDLRAHNKTHGVTDMRDYGGTYFEKKGKEMHNERIGNTKQAKRERQQVCLDTLRKFNVHQ